MRFIWSLERVGGVAAMLGLFHRHSVDRRCDCAERCVAGGDVGDGQAVMVGVAGRESG